MLFKLILIFVDDTKTNVVVEAARKAGAKGATIINNARGEGINEHKTFLGLSLETQRDVVLMVVESSISDNILTAVNQAGDFEAQSGSGIVLQIDIEKAIGVSNQFSVDENK